MKKLLRSCCITVYFTLFFLIHISSFAQTCNVKLKGTLCASDTISSSDSLQAVFSGGTLSSLVWLWGGNQYIGAGPVYYSTVETVAGLTYSGAGSAPDQLNNPSGVYVDANNNIFIADAGNNRIQKWAPGATSGVTVAGGNGSGSAANQLSSPQNVFADANGNIYVADADNNRIQKWAPGAISGVTVAGGNGYGADANQLAYPYGIFLDDAGNIYVADANNNRIQKWAPGATSGITVAGGNGSGSNANQLNFPTGLFIDKSRNILIADAGNNRIQKWAPGATSGVTVAGGNGQGDAYNQLNFPESVCTDNAGNIYVADSYNNRVMKWKPGDTTGTFVGPSTILRTPSGVTLDATNNLYVTDKGDNRIQKYLSHVVNTKYLPNSGYGTSGNYRVIATSQEGCVDTSETVTVFQTEPLDGKSDVFLNEQNLVYQVISDSSFNYKWTVPSDATIVSGQGTSKITVNWGTSSGNVIAKSGCLVLKLHVTITPDSLICYDQTVPKISFKGKAPAPWAIDGKVDDWETILGPSTGRNFMPYYPPRTSGFNWSRDGKINREPSYAILPEIDNPAPDRDLIFDAFTNDDYNVYFYFRRLNNKNVKSSFFYFCDINADGYMRLGEPVFYGSFDSANILSLSMGIFIPDTTLKPFPDNPFSTPYIKGKGDDMSSQLELDGFHMPGKVKELFNCKNIPFIAALKRNEIFSAAVTEDGYGVEFAVPWRYFRDWLTLKPGLNSKDVFAYRISLLKGQTEYDTAKVADDANNCCGSLAVSNNTKVINKISVTQLDSGLSYRFNLSYYNPTNAVERVSIENILLSNLSYTSNQAPSSNSFHLDVASDSDCDGKFDNFTYGAFNEGGDWTVTPPPTIDFEDSLYFSEGSSYGPAIHIPPHEKGCFVANLTVPPTMSLINSSIEFNGSVRYWLHEIYDRCQDGGGGRTINPVGKSKATIGGQNAVSIVSVNNLIEDTNNEAVKIFPNPNNGTAKILLPANKGNVDVELYDLYGRTVKYWRQFNSNTTALNNLSSGIYLVKVIFQDGNTVTKKMVVSK